MRIVRWSKRRGRGQAGMMVRASREEAMRLAISLLQQIQSNDNNTDRAEFTCEDGSYFSVAVLPEGLSEDRVELQVGGQSSKGQSGEETHTPTPGTT
jgi:hypothetical protein